MKINAWDFDGWAQVLDELLSQGISYLNYTPRNDPSSRPINELCSQVRDLLCDEGSGVALIDVGQALDGNPGLTDKAKLLVVIIGNKFGTTVTRNYQGTSPFFPLYYRKEGNKEDYIGNGQSNNQPGIHTDGSAWRDARVDLLGLLSVRRAAYGGATIVVNALRVFEALTAEMKDYLRSRSFIRQDPFDPLNPKPVRRTIYRELATGFSRGLTIRYHRTRIEGGHRFSGEPLSRRDLTVLDEFDGVLGDARFHHECFLDSGQILFLNNSFICHDRTPFADDERPRLIYRYWSGALYESRHASVDDDGDCDTRVAGLLSA